MVFPHGIHVDRDGNIWVTDGNDNLPRRAPGRRADAPLPPTAGEGRRPPGVQVQPRRQAAADARQARRQPARSAGRSRRRSTSRTTSSPTRTATSSSPKATATPRRRRRGSIRFDKTGKFLASSARWAPALEGEFISRTAWRSIRRAACSSPTASNNRIQILDAETFKTLDTWYQFSRLSGIFIDKNDMIYGADSESGSVNPPHGAWKRGIRIGSGQGRQGHGVHSRPVAASARPSRWWTASR